MIEGINSNPVINFNPVGLSSPAAANTAQEAQDQFVRIFVSEMLKQGIDSQDNTSFNNDQMVDVISEELIKQGYFKALETK
jgi:phage major head subunit gpT-like protein